MNPIEEIKYHQMNLTTLIEGAKAANRDLTDAEVAEVHAVTARAHELKAAIERGQKNADLMAGGSGLEESVTGAVRAFNDASASNVKGFLDLSPRGLKAMANTMAEQAIESKALVAGGSTATQVTLAPGIVRMGGGGLAFLSALPVIKHDTPSWKYLRQTVRTSNVAVTAEGAQKPTSVVTVAEVDGSLAIYPTLSEPVGKYLLRDNEQLKRFIAQELVYMVASTVQADAIAALTSTSGVQSVSAAASPIVSVRKGIQAVEDIGFEANLIVLNSSDYFDIVTTRNAGGSFDVSGGVGADEEAPKLWGRQVVSVTSGIAAGSALVLDRNAVALDMDTVGYETEWNPYAGFGQNTVQARTEVRAGFSVFQPAALALTDLAAP